MSKPSRSAVSALAIGTVVAAALCLPGLVAQKQKTAPASSAKSSAANPAPAELPAGDMQETARNACTICHDAGIIVQQRLSKEAWTREVDKMVRWGTVLDPKDRDPLIEYLSSNFPPDKQAGPVSRVSAGK
jgi:cytochrome c5